MYTKNEMCNLETLFNNNVIAYSKIYLIEVALREFIIESLSQIDNTKLYKKTIPKDIVEKMSEGIKYENKTPWKSYVKHHPIYYSDFSNIRTIIEKNDNWINVFKSKLKNKELLIPILKELEFIRNKVAHNRKVTSTDLSIVNSNYEKIIGFIGIELFNSLVQRCTNAEDSFEKLLSLKSEILTLKDECFSLKEINNFYYFELIKEDWWFDECYLSFNINIINDLYNLLGEYKSIPRTRGNGFIAENWLKNNQEKLNNCFEKSIEILNNILNIKE